MNNYIKVGLKWTFIIAISFLIGYIFNAYQPDKLNRQALLIDKKLTPFEINTEKQKIPINKNSITVQNRSNTAATQNRIVMKTKPNRIIAAKESIQVLDSDIPLGPTLHPTDMLEENEFIDEYVPQEEIDQEAYTMENEGIPYDDIESMLTNPTVENISDAFTEPEEITLQQREGELYISWTEAGVSEEDMDAMYKDLIGMQLENTPIEPDAKGSPPW